MNLSLFDRHGPTVQIPDATAATIGVFDGVHTGHQDLLRQLTASSGDLPTVAVALTAHPSYVLGQQSHDLWLDEADEHRTRLLAAGADYVAELPFTPEVASLSACTMVEALQQQLHLRCLLLGYDSRFGSRLHDDFPLLPSFAARCGITLISGTPFTFEGTAVSSSRIREALRRGDVSKAATLLGHPYSLAGRIVHGRATGRTLGFPTANIALDQSRKLWPAQGVYAVTLRTADRPDSPLPGMANLGAAPTFGIDKPLLEVYLLNFTGDLYGQTVSIDFLHRLRDTRHFATPEALQQQLNQDRDQCQAIFNQTL